MRIADVAEFYAEGGGGVRTYIDAKMKAAADRGHHLTIIAPRPTAGTEERDGGRIVYVPSPPVPLDPRYALFASRRAVHAALAAADPDVIEASSPYGGAWFASSYPRQAVRAFVFHQDPVAALAHPLLDRWISEERLDRWAAPAWAYLRRLGSRFHTTVVAGAWLADRLRGLGLPRVEAVPFGIDPAPFRAARPDPDLRAQWLEATGLGPGGRILVAVSRFHPEKRLPTLFEAVGRLSNVGLVVFGHGPDRARVERAARRCSRIWLAGHTRDRAALAAALATGDAFLHGSAAETFGLVVSEALAAGLPVVVPDAGGAAERADPAFAETYPAGDAEACARAIERLFDRDQGKLRAAARSAPIPTADHHFDALFAHYTRLRGAN